MKVLWFTNTMSCYTPIGSNIPLGYNGGGWISSAEKVVRDENKIELGISFLCEGQPFKQVQNNVVYYPIPQFDSSNLKYIRFLTDLLFAGSIIREEKKWIYYTNYYKKIIVDFNPDIIHVWGSEFFGGLVSKVTKIPVVLHIQGVLLPYYNAFLPPFVSWHSFVFSSLNPLSILKQNIIKRKWAINCYREREIYKNINIYLGRTDWDCRVSHVLNPSSIYYHVDEILRDVFYKEHIRELPSKLTIVTTISNPLYKGFDLILKTAKLLKEALKLDFEWQCYGNINPLFIEKITGVNHDDVNVHLMGVAPSDVLCEAELEATLYFHPSYIDNSPNSLCEAQMLGVPVVCTDVGGVASLIKDRDTGFLIPANDPYQGAAIIEMLYLDKELNRKIGEAGKIVAQKRHNVEKIKSEIINVYNSIISQS